MIDIRERLKDWMLSGESVAKVRSICLPIVKRGNRILEIGPGDGGMIKDIYSFGLDNDLHLDVHALDYLDSVLERLPKGIHKHRFDLKYLGDWSQGLRELPFEDESFDLIILMEVIEHITFPQIMISELARICRHWGGVVLTTPNIFSFGNRLATFLGTDKVFRKVGEEGFITTIEFDPYGHVAHYSFRSLAGLLVPWFEIMRREASGFKIPILRFFQPILIRLLTGLSNHIIIVASKKNIGDTKLKVVNCIRKKDKELTLPDGRCLHPMPHLKVCHSCEYFHKDFLHSRDPRKRSDYVPRQ